MPVRRVNLFTASPALASTIYHQLMAALNAHEPVIGLSNAAVRFVGRDHLGCGREMEIFHNQLDLERSVLHARQTGYVLSEFCPLSHRLAAQHAVPLMMDPLIAGLDREYPALHLVFDTQDGPLHRALRTYYGCKGDDPAAQECRDSYAMMVFPDGYTLGDLCGRIRAACTSA